MIGLVDFQQLIDSQGFGKIYWNQNQLLGDAFVTMEVCDSDLAKALARVVEKRTSVDSQSHAIQVHS